jgi:hypothetical protein
MSDDCQRVAIHSSRPQSLRMTSVAVHRFTYEVAELGLDYDGFSHVYSRGSRVDMTGYVVTIDPLSEVWQDVKLPEGKILIPA